MESTRQVKELEAFQGTGIYGIEWGDPDTDPWLHSVVTDWIGPNIGPEQTILEIGSGGGRWSRYLQNCKLAYLVDASRKSEELIRRICDCSRFRFVLSSDGWLPDIESDSIDYIFSFDTFVHFEAALFYFYMVEFRRVLKPGGTLHLHYASAVGKEHNPKCFKYREQQDVEDALRSFGFQVPIRQEVRECGFGSILLEAKLLNTK